MLKVDRITKKLGRFALQEISFEVAAGAYFVLLGHSGAGKSLLLEILVGLIAPDAGAVWLNSANITRAAIQHRGLGWLPQDQTLFPHLTVRDNIAYPFRCRGVRSGNLGAKVEKTASAVGAAGLLDRDPATLSQGEAQRVALARTLAADPDVLMLDEPLASLDVSAKAELRALLRKLHAAGQTILHVTHDYEEALALATRVAILEAGRISQSGTPDEVFHHPKSQFVAHFVGIRNFFKGNLAARGDQTARFTTDGLGFEIATHAPSGPGCMILRSEDVTVSLAQPHGSARNGFRGKIVDAEPAPLGVELTVDIGALFYALVTRASAEKLGLRPGTEVWVSFKSTAIQFAPER